MMNYKESNKAFGITPENQCEMIQARQRLRELVYPKFCQLCHTTLNLDPEEMSETLWNLWLPLAMKIASHRQRIGRPFIQGILGGQGTGKTTMSRVIALILQHLGYETLSFSIDDLYKTYNERLKLREEDPRLIWRGPPGTHDVDLGLDLLEQIRACQSPITVPRFDKSAYNGAGDRGQAEIIDAVSIVLFEGWFVGVQPVDSVLFDTAPFPIITDEDKIFARDINHKLREYLPLWSKLDSLFVLYPGDYRLSLEWRKQAEHKMIASGKSGMSNQEIEDFVYYFWRSLHPELFIKPLLQSSNNVNLVIEINADHGLGRVYQPG